MLLNPAREPFSVLVPADTQAVPHVLPIHNTGRRRPLRVDRKDIPGLYRQPVMSEGQGNICLGTFNSLESTAA